MRTSSNSGMPCWLSAGLVEDGLHLARIPTPAEIDDDDCRLLVQ
jgi:hypothetical protein